jgi:hypothetical protein
MTAADRKVRDGSLRTCGQPPFHFHLLLDDGDVGAIVQTDIAYSGLVQAGITSATDALG